MKRELFISVLVLFNAQSFVLASLIDSFQGFFDINAPPPTDPNASADSGFPPDQGFPPDPGFPPQDQGFPQNQGFPPNSGPSDSGFPPAAGSSSNSKPPADTGFPPDTTNSVTKPNQEFPPSGTGTLTGGSAATVNDVTVLGEFPPSDAGLPLDANSPIDPNFPGPTFTDPGQGDFGGQSGGMNDPSFLDDFFGPVEDPIGQPSVDPAIGNTGKPLPVADGILPPLDNTGLKDGVAGKPVKPIPTVLSPDPSVGNPAVDTGNIVPSFVGNSGDQSMGTNLGPSQLGPSELGPSQLGPSQLGPSELGPSQLGPSQLGPSQLEPSQLGPSQLGPSQLGPSQLGPSDPNDPFVQFLPDIPAGGDFVNLVTGSTDTFTPSLDWLGPVGPQDDISVKGPAPIDQGSAVVDQGQGHIDRGMGSGPVSIGKPAQPKPIVPSVQDFGPIPVINQVDPVKDINVKPVDIQPQFVNPGSPSIPKDVNLGPIGTGPASVPQNKPVSGGVVTLFDLSDIPSTSSILGKGKPSTNDLTKGKKIPDSWTNFYKGRRPNRPSTPKSVGLVEDDPCLPLETGTGADRILADISITSYARNRDLRKQLRRRNKQRRKLCLERRRQERQQRQSMNQGRQRNNRNNRRNRNNNWGNRNNNINSGNRQGWRNNQPTWNGGNNWQNDGSTTSIARMVIPGSQRQRNRRGRRRGKRSASYGRNSDAAEASIASEVKTRQKRQAFMLGGQGMLPNSGVIAQQLGLTGPSQGQNAALPHLMGALGNAQSLGQGIASSLGGDLSRLAGQVLSHLSGQIQPINSSPVLRHTPKTAGTVHEPKPQASKGVIRPEILKHHEGGQSLPSEMGQSILPPHLRRKAGNGILQIRTGAGLPHHLRGKSNSEIHDLPFQTDSINLPQHLRLDPTIALLPSYLKTREPNSIPSVIDIKEPANYDGRQPIHTVDKAPIDVPPHLGQSSVPETYEGRQPRVDIGPVGLPHDATYDGRQPAGSAGIEPLPLGPALVPKHKVITPGATYEGRQPVDPHLEGPTLPGSVELRQAEFGPVELGPVELGPGTVDNKRNRKGKRAQKNRIKKNKNRRGRKGGIMGRSGGEPTVLGPVQLGPASDGFVDGVDTLGGQPAVLGPVQLGPGDFIDTVDPAWSDPTLLGPVQLGPASGDIGGPIDPSGADMGPGRNRNRRRNRQNRRRQPIVRESQQLEPVDLSQVDGGSGQGRNRPNRNRRWRQQSEPISLGQQGGVRELGPSVPLDGAAPPFNVHEGQLAPDTHPGLMQNDMSNVNPARQRQLDRRQRRLERQRERQMRRANRRQGGGGRRGSKRPKAARKMKDIQLTADGRRLRPGEMMPIETTTHGGPVERIPGLGFIQWRK